jgi:hypothetical protein
MSMRDVFHPFRLPPFGYVMVMLALVQLACQALAPAGAPTAAPSTAPPTSAAAAQPSALPPAMTATPSPAKYHYARLADPARTQVTDRNGHWLAMFTDQAYTVTLTGPQRTFSETAAKNPVVSTIWVRVLPAPFSGQVDEAWLTQALANTAPDVLAVAMQYIAGAPAVLDSTGLQIGGKANYGPVAADDTREEGGDFYDYLGVPWKFGAKTRQPQATFFRSLDCSGFMRMVWGYRSGLPLTYAPDGGASLPRHSWEILSTAPGVVIIPDVADAQITDFSRLSVGDLVFFHAKTEDHAPQIDHVGMYLGQDTAGHYRFISSRQTINGPTLGDVGGASLLDGKGLYAKSFRAARRL